MAVFDCCRLCSVFPDRDRLWHGLDYDGVGGLSGFLGGLLAAAGPPLIYHYYRQPLELIRIRNTLILLFAVTSGVRTLFVLGQGQMSVDILMLFVWAFPVVALATWFGRRWPPPVTPRAMRRLVFSVLMLIGTSLIVAGLLP